MTPHEEKYSQKHRAHIASQLLSSRRALQYGWRRGTGRTESHRPGHWTKTQSYFIEYERKERITNEAMFDEARRRRPAPRGGRGSPHRCTLRSVSALGLAGLRACTMFWVGCRLLAFKVGSEAHARSLSRPRVAPSMLGHRCPLPP